MLRVVPLPTANADDLHELAVQAQRGDRAAFAQLARATSGRAFRLAARLCGRREEAEDVIQESYLRAFAALPSFKTELSFTAWLLAIVANCARDVLKSKRVSATDLVAEVPDDRDRVAPDSPEQRMQSRELQARLRLALLQIDPDCRSAVILKDVEEFEYEEIAAVQGVPVSTLKKRVRRGREALKALLGDLEWEKES